MDINAKAKEMILEWKLMVFKQEMSVKEYDIRREAIDEFFYRLDLNAPRPVGWVALKKTLKQKDPSFKVPTEIASRCNRGKY